MELVTLSLIHLNFDIQASKGFASQFERIQATFCMKQKMNHH